MLTLLLGSACASPPPAREKVEVARDSTPADSLALATPAAGEIWFTLTRSDRDASGHSCQERGLEIRRAGKRIPVPLLYTRETPVLLNDSTARATLWTNCVRGDAYLVDLRSGRPTPERSGRAR
jgi:hypothetical protein